MARFVVNNIPALRSQCYSGCRCADLDILDIVLVNLSIQKSTEILLIYLQAQINSDRILQESLRAQGWGCNQEQPLQPRKRDLEDDPGHNVRG